MQETEIEVNSFEETNELLEKLGFSYRSYQEKRREKYILNEHEIDIDTWPKLLPYIEIEGKDKNDIEKILSILGYSFKDTISCTDEIPTQDEEQTSNSNELDNTVTTETLPKTGLNTIILIIIFGVGILVVIFYIKMRTNLLKISKDR